MAHHQTGGNNNISTAQEGVTSVDGQWIRATLNTTLKLIKCKTWRSQRRGDVRQKWKI